MFLKNSNILRIFCSFVPVTMQNIPGPKLDKLYLKDVEKIGVEIPVVEMVDASLQTPGREESQVPVGWALFCFVGFTL